MVEAAIVAIGIQPVVSEWFYRGVVQQGVVAQLGAGRGIVMTALLYALALSAGVIGTSFVLWFAATLSEFVTGMAYGVTRHYSGSLLAPILLHVGLNASANLALGFATRLPIPGFNAAGAHTPIQFLMPAAASVAVGVALLVRFGGRPRSSPHPKRARARARARRRAGDLCSSSAGGGGLVFARASLAAISRGAKSPLLLWRVPSLLHK